MEKAADQSLRLRYSDISTNAKRWPNRITRGVFMRYIFLFACIVLGLATSPATHAKSIIFYGPIYSSYRKSLESGGGCISGSIGTTLPTSLKLTLFIASEKNAASRLKTAELSFLSYNKSNEHQIYSGHIRADTFTMCLKPGRYELLGLIAIGLYTAERVHIPFDVEAGKHVYVGSLILYGQGTQPNDCDSPELPMFVGISNEQNRDIPLISSEKNFVGITPTPAIISPSLSQPFFVSCPSSL